MIYKGISYPLLKNCDKCFLNPYKVMVEEAMSRYGNMVTVPQSLEFFYCLSKEKRSKLMDGILKYCMPGTTFKVTTGSRMNLYAEDAKYPAVTIDVPGCGEFNVVCTKYSGKIKNKRISSTVAAIEFPNVSAFDYMDVPRSDNSIMIVEKPGENRLGELISLICMAGNFDEFLKVYKIQSMRDKNVYKFADTLVKPVAGKYSIIFYDTYFVIGVIHNSTLYHRKIEYTDYLKGLKSYANKLKEIIDAY